MQCDELDIIVFSEDLILNKEIKVFFLIYLYYFSFEFLLLNINTKV